MTTQITLPREVVEQLVQSLEFYIHEIGIKSNVDEHYTKEDFYAFDAAKLGRAAITEPAHTDDALKQAMHNVLERAAQACDEVEKYPSLGPRHCAESIRSMIGEIK